MADTVLRGRVERFPMRVGLVLSIVLILTACSPGDGAPAESAEVESASEASVSFGGDDDAPGRR